MDTSKSGWTNYVYYTTLYSRQLALDGVVDTDLYYTSNNAGSSPSYYLLSSPIYYFKLYDPYYVF